MRSGHQNCRFSGTSIISMRQAYNFHPTNTTALDIYSPFNYRITNSSVSTSIDNDWHSEKILLLVCSGLLSHRSEAAIIARREKQRAIDCMFNWFWSPRNWCNLVPISWSRGSILPERLGRRDRSCRDSRRPNWIPTDRLDHPMRRRLRHCFSSKRSFIKRIPVSSLTWLLRHD